MTRCWRELFGRPFGERRSAWEGRIGAFADQSLQGAANVLVNIILARNLPREEFATIGVLLGIHYFVNGLHRSAVVLPFILDASGEGAEARAAEHRWWWINVASTVGLALILGASAAMAMLLVPGDRYAWFRDAIVIAVAVTPALLLFEFGRRVLYQRRLAMKAALVSAGYFLLILGSAWLLVRQRPSAGLGAMAWVVAGLGAGSRPR